MAGLPGCAAAPPPRPEPHPSAMAFLMDAYPKESVRSFLRTVLASTDPSPAVRWIERELRDAADMHRIRNLAYALGWLGYPESTRPILRKLGGARGGPRRGGVIFGGDTDQAHYALIWAVSRLEGETFEGAPDHFSALMDWWMRYPVRREDLP